MMIALSKSAFRRVICQLTLSIGEPFFWLMGMRRKGREIDLTQVKRVLVVRLDEIGDVVMMTPFLRELRRNLPDAWITLVVKPGVYNLTEHCPYVNEVLTFHWQTSRLWRRLAYLRMAFRDLWRRRFHLVILPRWGGGYYHGSVIAYLSGAPWRMGYSENVSAHKKQNNRGFDRLLTHGLKDTSVKHEVEHNLDVIRFLGGKVQDDRLELWFGEEDEFFAEELLRKHGVELNDLLVSLAPGAGASKRRWPLSRFAEVGVCLQEEYHAQFLIVGGPEEEALGRELQQELGDAVINTVGHTTLHQTAALLKRCRLFIGNDAGPMHIAAAVGVPVVEMSCHPETGSLLSANSPKRFGPWSGKHMVIQPKAPLPPCVDECVSDRPHCILGITVEQVKQAVAEQLARQGVKPCVKALNPKFTTHNSP
ncbi:glycosyltransferase family 9 protein [Desulfohalobiaceae bacterium Ax17]|uniref:glycosyltransferase family 9 protein n=1 Tax=Desulfovulcanus ferrireducens TaxID=2831190 RepID=UPI00207B9FAF|nr:glycosyltransferase family 9 protein [Desulfovulcanus ferrireducens]MBT8763361.1 glycosyltransferase family 9 protein [Desulfovulcanus ferrireducens]